MFWDNLEDVSLIPAPMDVLMVGGSRGSFIGRTSWIPTIRSIPELRFRYACPSRDPEKANRFAKVWQMTPTCVSSNFDLLLDEALKISGRDNLLVCIATDTATHASLIEKAVTIGARFILCDKPVVQNLAELERVRSVVSASDARVWITFNHRFNAGVHKLKELVAHALRDGKNVRLDAFFNQRWLLDDTKSQQAQARLNNPWCTLLDLGIHLADLTAFIAGREIVAVEGAEVRRHLTEEYPHVITGGSSRLIFESPHVEGTLSCSQCEDGEFMDDIGASISFENELGQLEQWMWRLRDCGGDSVLTNSPSVGPAMVANWGHKVERGSKSFASQNIVSTFSKTPPGHGSSDWMLMWWYMFQACLADIWIERDFPISKYLEPHHILGMPSLMNEGSQTTDWVHAHVASAENGGARVALADVK